MHLFLKKIYRKNPFPKIYRINQCEVLIRQTEINLEQLQAGIYWLLIETEYGLWQEKVVKM